MDIKTVSQFISELSNIHRDNNFVYYFRGHSNENFELKPSIYRRQTYLRNEDVIFKEAMLRSPQDFYNDRTTLEKLVKIQHYGIPTRLLDITSNPLIALYFACNELMNSSHGKVIMFKIPKSEIKYFDSDTVSILSNLCKRPFDFRIDNLSKNDITSFNKSASISYLLHEIREEKPYFLPIIEPEDLERVVAVKVKHNNNRITRQDGAFLIFGIHENKSIPAKVPKKWILHNGKANFGFKILQNRKIHIKLELERIGINKSTLFPELQNLGDYLKDFYYK